MTTEKISGKAAEKNAFLHDINPFFLSRLAHMLLQEQIPSEHTNQKVSAASYTKIL